MDSKLKLLGTVFFIILVDILSVLLVLIGEIDAGIAAILLGLLHVMISFLLLVMPHQAVKAKPNRLRSTHPVGTSLLVRVRRWLTLRSLLRMFRISRAMMNSRPRNVEWRSVSTQCAFSWKMSLLWKLQIICNKAQEKGCVAFILVGNFSLSQYYPGLT